MKTQFEGSQLEGQHRFVKIQMEYLQVEAQCVLVQARLGALKVDVQCNVLDRQGSWDPSWALQCVPELCRFGRRYIIPMWRRSDEAQQRQPRALQTK